MKLQIKHNQYRYENSTPDPNDSWDRANTATEHEVGDTVKKFPNNAIISDYVLVSDDIVYENDTGYLVCAVYSTGDSFGYDEDYMIEFIDVYKTIEEADKTKRLLENGVRDILSSSGKLYQYYIPWNGYFEQLSYIEVMGVDVI